MTLSTSADQINNNSSSNEANASAPSPNNKEPTENVVESMEVEENSIENEYTVNDVVQLVQKPLKLGDNWYVVDKSWYDSFLKSLENNEHLPGPINCINLIVASKDAAANICLKPNLEENVDFVLVPSEAWAVLASKFGVVGPPIVRSVIPRTESYLQVELYPLQIRLALYGSKQDTVRSYSRTCTLSQVINDMKLFFEIPFDKEVQIWNNATLLVRNDEIPTSPKSNTLQQNAVDPPPVLVFPSKSIPPPPPPPPPTNLKAKSKIDKPLLYIPDLEVPNPVLTIEVQNNDGTWPSSKTKLGAVTRSRLNAGTPICQPGACGLMNLGNTCFMNSAIQCLSNTERLTKYFLSDQHHQDINPDNPLGMRGEIAKNYAWLIKMMWSGYQTSIAPREFRMAVTQFAPQFSGFAHHDCQELMAFLLDGLHEDLNRVKVKPYIEMKNDIEKRPDIVVAEEAWNNYKLRNDSIIVDTFHAQLKSTLVCPECELVSITFDPFCYLTLPLPYRIERSVDICFVPAMSKRPTYTKINTNPSTSEEFQSFTFPVRSILLENIMIPKTGCASDISASVAKFLNECSNNIDDSKASFKKKFDPRKLIVANANECRFNKFFSPSDMYNSQFDDIVVYEMDDLTATDSDSSSQTRRLTKFAGHHLPVFIKQLNSDSSECPISRPFFINVKSLTYETIREAIFKELLSLISPDKVNSFLEAMEKNIVEKRKVDNTKFAKRNQKDGNGSDGETGSDEELYISVNATNTNCTMNDASEEDEDLNDENVNSNISNNVSMKTISYPPYAICCNDHQTQMKIVLNPDSRLDNSVNEHDNYLTITIHYRIVTKFFPTHLNKFGHLKLTTLFPSVTTETTKSLLTLKECINQFTLTEKLGENDPWYCPRCKKHQMASKKFDIWSLPNNLIIHLKRFSYSRLHRDKLNVLVEFPIENLDMTPYILNNPNNESFVYDLIAVSNHYGELGAGHYNAYAKNFSTKNWFLFDDLSVSPVPDKKVMTKAAYVLFYQRKNMSDLTATKSTTESTDSSTITVDRNDIQASTSLQ